MASTTVDLTALASSTSAQLASLWTTIGVSETERADYLKQLTERVANLYTAAVQEQQSRQSLLQEEIDGLKDMIRTLHASMEQPAAVVPQAGATLIEYRNTLEAARSDLQNLYNERQAEMKALQETLASLYDEVQESMPVAFSELGEVMSTSRKEAFAADIARVGALKSERSATVCGLCDAIVDLWDMLEIDPLEGDETEARVAPEGDRAALGYGQAIIATLQGKVAELEEERGVREERVKEMGGHIQELWKRLSTPLADQTAFLEEHAGLGVATIEAVEGYLGRLQDEFAARLADLVASARGAIDKIWTEMRAGPEQRRAMFPPYFDESTLTDELLTAHEGYLDQLTAAIEDLRPLLKSIEKRDELKADKAEYEAIIADPSRLLARGNSSARLREEKLERRVKKELPAVTKKLREAVRDFEAKTGMPFLVDDARYVDTLDAEDAAEVKAKEDAKAARVGAAGAAAGAAGASSAGAAAAGGSGSGMPRAVSAGRMSVYRGASSSALSATSGPLGASMAAAAGKGAAPSTGAIVARKPAGTTAGAVAAPPAPLKETTTATGNSSSLSSSLRMRTATAIKPPAAAAAAAAGLDAGEGRA